MNSADKIKAIKEAAGQFWKVIDELCENSREKSIVKTKIDEARLWAREAVEKQSAE